MKLFRWNIQKPGFVQFRLSQISLKSTRLLAKLYEVRKNVAELGTVSMNGFRKKSIATIFLWCIFAVLLILGFNHAGTISRFSVMSLRYQTPINGQAAQRARQYAISNEAFWPTFWHESRASLTIGRGYVQSNIMAFSGDAHLVWHTEYIVGSAPGPLDNSGVAVSKALAHSLWGSIDIIGLSVNINGETRTVRGVFSGNTELALLPFHINDTTQYWTGVELYGSGTTFSDATNFATASGLGMPDYVLTGGIIAFAGFLAVLPLLLPAIYSLVLIIKFVRRYYSKLGVSLLFAALTAFAILLPSLLNILPDWLIPTRWSDFSFWSLLFNQAEAGFREFLSVPPKLRDVELKIKLLRLIGISFVSICCGLLVCFRQRR